MALCMGLEIKKKRIRNKCLFDQLRENYKKKLVKLGIRGYNKQIINGTRSTVRVHLNSELSFL